MEKKKWSKKNDLNTLFFEYKIGESKIMCFYWKKEKLCYFIGSKWIHNPKIGTGIILGLRSNLDLNTLFFEYKKIGESKFRKVKNSCEFRQTNFCLWKKYRKTQKPLQNYLRYSRVSQICNILFNVCIF